MITRLCCTCNQPGADYLVTWRIVPNSAPINIYAHKGQCAKTAEATHGVIRSSQPSAQPRPTPPPHQLSLLP